MSDLEQRLAELKKSISEMTDDELYEAIGSSRNNRQASLKKPKKKASKKPTKAKVQKKEENVLDSLSELSPEQAEALLKKLQGKS